MAEHDAWAELADQFVTEHSASLKGQIRTHVVHRHLLEHLPPPPATVVDIGGGAGSQSLPLARIGYTVTIVDPSPTMLTKAAERIAREQAEVQQRIRLRELHAEDAPKALGESFTAVLCHGVIMYIDEPAPVVQALAELAAPGGVVSILALNAETLAVRPALEGRWRDALAAFDSHREVGVLGLPTRADAVDDLTNQLAQHGMRRSGWYGVWLFSDGWRSDDHSDDFDEVLAVEYEASRRDPYRKLSRLFHLLTRKDESPVR